MKYRQTIYRIIWLLLPYHNIFFPFTGPSKDGNKGKHDLHPKRTIISLINIPKQETFIGFDCVFSLVQPTKAIMENDKTTCEFQVLPLTLSDTGLWECRVSTSGGQDTGKFKVTVKGEMSI